MFSHANLSIQLRVDTITMKQQLTLRCKVILLSSSKSLLIGLRKTLLITYQRFLMGYQITIASNFRDCHVTLFREVVHVSGM